MEASGSGAAAAAGVKAGAPPRLVAVRGAAANGAAAGRQPARLVVFLGVADDASSRVAAALLAHRSRGRVRAVSASAATVDLDPVVAGSLAEIGVDLARCQTLPPTSRLLEQADLVVVMGYDQLAPAARRTEDWWIDDPRGKDADTVRCIRDAIDRRVQRLLIRLGIAVPARRSR
jgi:arsenate reductase (thioredoxin)